MKKFCGKCGAPLDQQTGECPVCCEKRKRRRKASYIIILGVIAIAFIVVFKNNKKNTKTDMEIKTDLEKAMLQMEEDRGTEEKQTEIEKNETEDTNEEEPIIDEDGKVEIHDLDSMTVTGVLYEEVYAGDTFYILKLDNPVDAILYNEFQGYNGEEQIITDIQLHFQKEKEAESFVGKKITVQGSVMFGHTQYHLTTILLTDIKQTETIEDSFMQEDTGNIKEETEYENVSLAQVIEYEASSELSEYNMTHSAERIMDGSLATAWVEGQDGQGTGETIKVTFDDAYVMSGIKIYAGYQKSDELYEKNSRPKQITLIFSDGATETIELQDMAGAQQIDLKNSVITESVTIRIDSVYPGTIFEDTAISEVYFY